MLVCVFSTDSSNCTDNNRTTTHRNVCFVSSVAMEIHINNICGQKCGGDVNKMREGLIAVVASAHLLFLLLLQVRRSC